MRPLFILVFIAALFGFSCSRLEPDTPRSLKGTWKMILVKDNATNALQAKPVGETKDVIVSFAPDSDSTGLFSGKTPTNTFGPDEYKTGPAQSLSILVYTTTKVAETAWGELFGDHFREARSYQITSGRLIITTSVKTLTFERLR